MRYGLLGESARTLCEHLRATWAAAARDMEHAPGNIAAQLGAAWAEAPAGGCMRWGLCEPEEKT